MTRNLHNNFAPISINPRSLVDYWADRDGARLALTTTNRKLTYAELAEQVQALAILLDELGIGPSTQIAIAFPNSIDFAIWLLAILKIGAVAVPMDPTLPNSEASRLMENGGVSLVALPKDHNSIAKQNWKLMLSTKNTALWLRAGTILKPSGFPPNILLHRFSSGTTGHSKHILCTEEQLREDYTHLLNRIRPTQFEKFIGVTPFYHAFGGLCFFSAMCAGGEVVLLSKFLPSKVIELAMDRKASIFFATPSMLDMLSRCHLKYNQSSAFNNLKWCICATGLLTIEVYRRFSERFSTNIHVLYGSSETLSVSMTNGVDPFIEGCVGLPFDGVQVEIIDEKG